MKKLITYTLMILLMFSIVIAPLQLEAVEVKIMVNESYVQQQINKAVFIENGQTTIMKQNI